MKQSKEIDYTNLYLSSTKNISFILDDAVDRQQPEFLNLTSDFFKGLIRILILFISKMLLEDGMQRL